MELANLTVAEAWELFTRQHPQSPDRDKYWNIYCDVRERKVIGTHQALWDRKQPKFVEENAQ